MAVVLPLGTPSTMVSLLVLQRLVDELGTEVKIKRLPSQRVGISICEVHATKTISFATTLPHRTFHTDNPSPQFHIASLRDMTAP